MKYSDREKRERERGREGGAGERDERFWVKTVDPAS